MGDSAGTWKEFVKDFWHGRTHSTYGLIASTLSSAYLTVFVNGLDLRIAAVVSLVGSVGGLTDIVAHLFYH